MKPVLYARRGLALAAGAYLGWVFFQQGIVKFDPEGFWSAPFERWGYPVWLRWLVGVVESVGGPLLVVPWLATWGGVAVAVVMVGAAVTRAMGGWWVDVAWVALYGAVSLWIAWEWRSFRIPRARGNEAATP